MPLQDLAQLKAAIHWRDPIIIVGAGPTGMITALGLARYNVPCIVLDDDTGPSLEGSRALLINKHTLKILDRKSTRLNSCHPSISYAVFCLKKKNNTKKKDNR